MPGRYPHLPNFAAHVDMCRAQKCYPKSREEPKPRSYGAQWFCHFNYGRTISFPDKSWNSGSALPVKFRGWRTSSCANKKNSKITNEAILNSRSRSLIYGIPAQAGNHRRKFMTHNSIFMDSRLRGNDKIGASGKYFIKIGNEAICTVIVQSFLVVF